MKTTTTTRTTTILALFALSAFSLQPSSLFSATTAPLQNTSAAKSITPAAAQTYTPKTAAPVITAQPASVTVTAGQAVNVSFTIAAIGFPQPAYQWQVSSNNGASWTNALNQGVGSGATTPTFTINGGPSTTFPDNWNGTQYRCIVTNAVGSATSATAIFNVKPPVTPPPTKPIFTKQPSGTGHFEPGQTIILVATATCNPAPTYQWMYGSGELSWPVTATEPGCMTTYTGQTTGTLTIKAALVPISGRNYWCVATNPAGAARSTSIQLLIMPGAPVITHQPVDAIIAIGKPATLSVSATGAPTLIYRWQRATPASPANFTNLNDGPEYKGAATATLTITPATATLDQTRYRCLVGNNYDGVNSNPATLTISSPPTITSQPASTTADMLATVSFTVKADAYPAPAYQWQRLVSGAWQPFTTLPGLNIPGMANMPSMTTTVNGVTGPVLTITNINPMIDASQFRCLVTNRAGSVTSATATLGVRYAPIITQQPPANKDVLKNQTITIKVTATANPTATYQWQHYGYLNNQNWTDIPANFTINGCTVTGVATDTLAVHDPGSAGTVGYPVRCKITNSKGTTYSTQCTLTLK